MPNITTNRAITYTIFGPKLKESESLTRYYAFLILLAAMLDHSYQLGLLVRGRNVLVVLRQIGAKITNSFPRY